jgi:hypothetical protein
MLLVSRSCGCVDVFIVERSPKGGDEEVEELGRMLESFCKITVNPKA